MREIKFRGKRADNGNWVYGNYIEKIDPTKKEPTFWASLIHDKALTAVEVDPKTVGQFTGLHDKNGNPIYEKDKVILFSKKTKAVYFNKDTGTQLVFTVLYKDACFWLYSEDVDYWFMPLRMIEDVEVDIEVIGNVFDNPELA